MSEDGRLFARGGSAAAPAASALAWLWRLGPVLSEPAADAVGFGTLGEAAELVPLVQSGRLRGLVLFAPDPGPAEGPVPSRRRRDGTARFEGGATVAGPMTVFEDGSHAARSGGLLALAADPSSAWTELRGFWILGALAPYLTEVLERPLVMLPPVGCVRLDDVPGTAQHQLEGETASDSRQARRVRALRRAYEHACLNVAVAARALEDGAQVPLESAWPSSVAALAEGVAAGAFEPVCHGYLHLDTDELEQGRVEFREFARLDEREAGRRLDEAMAWQEQALGRRPQTFCAPAWSYSPGALAAAAARGLPAWQRPELAPLFEGGLVRETVVSALRGLHGLGYAPLVALAGRGLPPTAVFHGGLFDLRLTQVRERRDLLTLAKVILKRDILRLPGLPGIRWVGAGELVRLLEAHATARVRGTEVDLGDASESLLWPL